MKSAQGIFQGVIDFAKMIKLSHTLFGLPFALVAAVFIFRAGAISIGFAELFYIVGAFTGARSFSMAVNRIADAAIDLKNPRTSEREIPAGRLSKGAVWAFAGASLIATWVFAWLLHPLAFYLSFPAAVLLGGYSYAKRFTWLCHFWLGGAIGMAPLGVYIALSQSLPPISWLLFATLGLYIAGFDILYALQDREFDIKEGLHSVPARFGIKGALRISEASHFLAFCGFVWLGFLANLGGLYFLGAAVIGALMIGEHKTIGWGERVSLEKIPAAFFNYNSAISILFFLFTAADVFI